MVDIVDLVDDSSDEEAETPKSLVSSGLSERASFPTTVSQLSATTNGVSSWLRDVVANGYQTTPPSVVASSATNPQPSTTGASTPKESSARKDEGSNIITQLHESDDDVVWIPNHTKTVPCTGGVESAFDTHNSLQANNSDPKWPLANTKDSEEDDEVVVVDPPPKYSTSAMKPRRNNATNPRKRKLHSGSSIFHDSDNDSDDCIENFKPSGLTGTSKNAKEPSRISSEKSCKPKHDIPEASETPMKRITNPSNPPKPDYQFFNPYSSTPVATSSSMARSCPETNPSATTPLETNRASHTKRPVIRNPYAKRPSPLSVVQRKSTPSTTGPKSNTIRKPSFTSPPSDDKSAKKRMVVNPYKSSGSKSGVASSSFGETCGVSYPTLHQNSKLYPDIRPNLVLGMWKYARSNLTRDSYERRRLDRYIGRIVDLAVTAHDFPIRSFGEYAFRNRSYVSKRGCGGISTMDGMRRLEEELDSTGLMDKKFQVTGPGNTQFCSIAEACLVAMKDVIVRRWKAQKESQQDPMTRFPSEASAQKTLFSQQHFLVSLVDLIPEIDRRLRPECPAKLGRQGEEDHGAAFYLRGSTRSAEFHQIEKLLAPIDVPVGDGSLQVTHYLKRRSVRAAVHYELTPKGFERAVIISKRAFPAPIGHYRASNLQNVVPKFDKICLAVDLREGGVGDTHRKVLHEMCNKLDMQYIPYFVSTLKIGDYCFFSGDKLCPILVERKSVEDVAKSMDIDDGRWQRQKHRMYQGQFVFGYNNCRIAYIIEGKVEKHLVSNGYIGNASHKITQERFEAEVANLEAEGFEVFRTCSVENSMFEMTRWAASVAKDVRSGKLKPELTYNEFVDKIKKIPASTDFSRLAAFHAQERKSREDQTIDLLSDDEDDIIMDMGTADTAKQHPGKGLLPIALDDRFRNASTPTSTNKEEKLPSPCSSLPIKSTKATNAKSLHQKSSRTTSELPKNSTWRNAIVIPKRASAQNRFKLDNREHMIKEARGRFFEYTSPAVQAATANPTKALGLDEGPRTKKVKASSALQIEYSKWTAASLREKCVELGMKKTGNKAQLIERLMDPDSRPPLVYRLRQERNLYVPANIDTGATAILVAIQIQQDAAASGVYEYAGGTKEELYALAEAIDIKKNPFSGGTTQTGPYHYDGWSSMGKLKESGDPPLVIEKKRRFRLSTSGDVSGLKLARAMHVWCHKKGICKCMELGHTFNPEGWKQL